MWHYVLIHFDITRMFIVNVTRRRFQVFLKRRIKHELNSYSDCCQFVAVTVVSINAASPIAAAWSEWSVDAKTTKGWGRRRKNIFDWTLLSIHLLEVQKVKRRGYFAKILSMPMGWGHYHLTPAWIAGQLLMNQDGDLLCTGPVDNRVWQWIKPFPL